MIKFLIPDSQIENIAGQIALAKFTAHSTRSSKANISRHTTPAIRECRRRLAHPPVRIREIHRDLAGKDAG
jgi:hypothetical protein